jgi:mannose/cellobiose epimerase-like protein (N-acyl-D-glucosamine 2-epimerase family)
MNRKFLIITILFYLVFFSNLVFAQYELKSKYLINPDLNIGFVDSCASFWLNAYDETNGGFYTNVGKEGNVLTNWGTNKDMITQSRNAYGLTRAYMLTGNDTYLEYAEKALEFMHYSACDSINGGWYNSINKFGQPNNVN